MECNKDESLRAKSIAEDKIGRKDFSGAKTFALKAKTLNPELDGITQILTTVEVYISAENKIGGDTDWYGVLGVNPSSDHESIRKQYRKLALMLHPDKNKSVGADGAFNLISEAWSLLSDKTKRLAYNQRRGSKGLQRKVQMQTGGPSAPPRANRTFSFPKTKKNATQPKPPSPTPAPDKKSNTFWTICFRCKMHYEYLKVYRNHTLLCPNCHEAFMATETAPPYSFSKSSNQALPCQQQQHGLNNHSPSQSSYDPVRNAQKSGLGSDYLRHPHEEANNVCSTDPSIAAKAANVVQQARDKVKRAYSELHGITEWLEGCVKKTKIDDNNNDYSSRYGTNYHNKAHGNNSSFGIGGGGVGALGSKFYGFSNINRQPTSNRDLTMAETRTMLMAKSRKEIINTIKCSEKKTTTTKAADREKTDRSKGRSDDNETTEGPVDASMTVPDPDFHDFDEDRTESSFGDNEVWAAYDDDDGMPRFYAMISKVISKNPFKLRISWLNSKTTDEFGSLDWVGSGFYKTCGEFRVGRYETCKSINSFSQKVNWDKGPRGSIMILPRKGDVWALYKNWSSSWTETTPDEVIHKYEMMIIIDEYDEERGASVAPLLKVAGFKTIFRPSVGSEWVKRVPKEEMFRFSHRVPNYSLSGLEGPNAPKGCLELDPAATPLELLQVILA